MSDLIEWITDEERTDIIIRSLIGTIDALEQHVDALEEERDALRAHLDRESAELTAVYNGNQVREREVTHLKRICEELLSVANAEAAPPPLKNRIALVMDHAIERAGGDPN